MSNVVGSNANNGNKRKRDSEDVPSSSKRNHPLAPNGAPNPADEEHNHHQQAQAALESYPDPTSAYGNAQHDSSNAAAEAAILQFSNDPSFLVSQTGVPDQGESHLHDFSLPGQPSHNTNSPYNLPGYPDPTRSGVQPQLRENPNELTPYTGEGGSSSKPAVGTEEWHQIRKDNHKEVERRRRETINEGINALAQIIPDAEKNKGAILSQAVKYIHDLEAQIGAESRGQSLTQGTMAQAVQEISSMNDHLKQQVAHDNETIMQLSAQNEQLRADNENAGRLLDSFRKRITELGGKYDDLEGLERQEDEGMQILEGLGEKDGNAHQSTGQSQVQTANMGGSSRR